MADETKLEIDWGSDKLNRAQQTVIDTPYDLESWSLLIREAQTRWINDVRPLFERLVSTFPSSGRYWKIYIEQEMKARNFEKVEKLFQRCLMKVLNIDLWKLYLTYVKETKSSLASYKEKMAQAYDFALEKIGMDIQSYSIWSDYVNFLKGVEAVGSYAENQKISAVRKVYQRGVVNPMVNIEQLWKDYMAFEQAINPIIAEKMGMERSKDYMNARRVAKELEAVTRGLNRNIPSVPPAGTIEELRQVELWKKYIAWEKSNPLRSEDTSLVTRRVMFAFEQCLLCLGHHADVWYEAAQFLDQSSKILTEKGDVTAAKLFSDEAGAVFERATSTLLKNNMLLYFAFADFEEGRMKYEKVHQIYDRFLDMEDNDPTLAYIQYMKFARRAEGIKTARTVFKRAREDTRSRFQVYVAAALMEYYSSKDKNIAFRIFELGLKKFPDSPDYVLCYIDYLSHLNEDNNTRVLFERVLSSGSLEPEKSVEIWNRFLEFESNIGDLASIVKVERRRAAVLESVTINFAKAYHPPPPPPTYTRFSRHRSFGRSGTGPPRSLPITPRMLRPHPLKSSPPFFREIKEFEGKETAQLVDRYKFLDLFPCTPAELKSIGYNLVTSAKTYHSAAVDSDDESTSLPRPDLSQMIPFKPKVKTIPGDHPVSGGVFPYPPAVAQLCSNLCPPECFHGPFVGVDALMEQILRLDIACPTPSGENGHDVKLFDMAKSVQYVNGDGSGGEGYFAVKRKKRLGADDSDDDDLGIAPPANDIYRQRQQKRVK